MKTKRILSAGLVAGMLCLLVGCSVTGQLQRHRTTARLAQLTRAERTKKQSDDPVFKAYRKEYKRRFAWIRAGRISDTDFYAWSEQAREMKKKCDRDIITLEEYVDWLKHP